MVELVEGAATPARVAIAGRYLGAHGGERFAAEQRSKPGVLLVLVPDSPRVGTGRESCPSDPATRAFTQTVRLSSGLAH